MSDAKNNTKRGKTTRVPKSGLATRDPAIAKHLIQDSVEGLWEAAEKNLSRIERLEGCFKPLVDFAQSMAASLKEVRDVEVRLLSLLQIHELGAHGRLCAMEGIDAATATLRSRPELIVVEGGRSGSEPTTRSRAELHMLRGGPANKSAADRK